MTINYRESYGIFASCGILFNHESERRGYEFVTRKITDGVAKIVCGKCDSITLGDLSPKRDWGHAPDYVEAMWRMLQSDTPSEYVVATNENHTVEDFVREAFSCVGINDWERYVKQDAAFMRPAEIHNLKGNPTKANTELLWTRKTEFNDMVKLMVENDIKLVRKNG
jgi:GDPmannose 4,6-dehydratase